MGTLTLKFLATTAFMVVVCNSNFAQGFFARETRQALYPPPPDGIESELDSMDVEPFETMAMIGYEGDPLQVVYESYDDVIGTGGLLERRHFIPESVMQMIRRGAVEDFSVTQYQKNQLIHCPLDAPCKKAHETSFRCKCTMINKCWAPGRFNDAKCKFTAPPFGVKFYQP